ncbi:LysR family transcriptional regulator [Streptomyces sp. B6B3]|uniref:LysR family transcriptional regulator n=1 Tax=Streptomyces sp. B6B3 TaxID=3153570 RepID=UPI00325F5135
MLDLHRLMLLREIGARGSMSAAARNLAYSHSTISQQMSILEREAGVVLLERVGRGVRLTEAAEQLVRHTEAVLSILERAQSDLASAHARIRGTITLAAFSTAARAVLPEALLRLGHLYPELSVDVEQHEPEEGLARLAARRVDLLIADEFPGAPLSVGPALHAEPLHTDPVGAYLPVGSEARSVADLGELAWAMEPAGTGSFAWARRLCRDIGFEPRIRYRSADPLCHLRLVEAGLAAAFLPRLVVRESGTRLERCPLVPGDLERRLYAVSREGSQDRPVILACQAVIRGVLASLSGP